MFYYDGKNPILAEEVDKPEKIYNKLVKKMEAKRVAVLNFEVVGGHQILCHLYEVTDYNYPIYDEIKADKTVNSSCVVSGKEIVAQKSYAAVVGIHAKPNKECQDKSIEPCKYVENIPYDEYCSLCDPRAFIVERNYPKPYCDVAKDIISKRQDVYANQLELMAEKRNPDGTVEEKNIKLSEGKDALTNLVVKDYMTVTNITRDHTIEELLEDDGRELE